MSNEDFERQMAFILEQQARFSVDIEKQKERMDLVTSQIEELGKQVAQLTGFAAVLKDAFVSLTHHVERHDKEIAELIQQGKETDARLNALILVVERHVSSHQ
jgi:uncharacterized protein YoxC